MLAGEISAGELLRSSLATMTLPSKSWRESVFYQVYPLSFCDSGSGTGDLNGIRSKLPILRALGVNYVWLCPVYASPETDSGYDIRDYRRIHRAFGKIGRAHV